MTINRQLRRTAMRDAVLVYVAVAAGAALGGTLRALVAVGAHGLASPFPWATLTVNVLGSFAIGFYGTLTAPDGRLFMSPRQRQFVMAGLCGGFTTFSVFSLETFRFAAAGRFDLAAVNAGVSVTLWLVAVWVGSALAARLNRPGRR